jgi:hypothetical protein
LAPDGSGGFYVLWTDSRNYLTTEDDLFMQRILASGDIAPGWPLAGLVICDTVRDQRGLDLISDGVGGAIATWNDFRSQAAGTSSDLYAQRVRPDGSITPGWQRQGSPVTRAPDIQWSLERPGLASDGAEGAYCVWESHQFFTTPQRLDVGIQRLTGAGVPAPGWPQDGRVLCSAFEHQRLPIVASDGAGGAFAAWIDYRNLPNEYERFRQGEAFGTRVRADGSDAPGWTPGGQLLHSARGRPDALIPDGFGGVYVVLAFPTGDSQGESLFVAQRLTASGAPALGWPAEGVTLCDALGRRNLGPSRSDGLGGLLTSWVGGPGAEVYVTRLRPDGTRPPGWPEDGLVASSPAANPYGEFKPSIAPDGVGGCYVAWERPGDTYHHSVIQHIAAVGAVAPGWPVDGITLPVVSLGTTDPVLLADGYGGVFVVYSSPTGSPYALHYGQDGVVAAAVSLVHAEARSHEVELRWYVAGEVGFRATLERRDRSTDDWWPLVDVSPDGTGAILYTDRSVEPGRRYAYRLRWSEHGATRMTTEAWVETPSLLRFALHGLQPNPSRGDAYAALTLPGWANGELELLDVSGRRVASREVGSLGPGRHVVRLDEREPVPPGLYLLRLRWSDREATGRAIVMR